MIKFLMEEGTSIAINLIIMVIIGYVTINETKKTSEASRAEIALIGDEVRGVITNFDTSLAAFGSGQSTAIDNAQEAIGTEFTEFDDSVEVDELVKEARSTIEALRERLQ